MFLQGITSRSFFHDPLNPYGIPPKISGDISSRTLSRVPSRIPTGAPFGIPGVSCKVLKRICDPSPVVPAEIHILLIIQSSSFRNSSRTSYLNCPRFLPRKNSCISIRCFSLWNSGRNNTWRQSRNSWMNSGRKSWRNLGRNSGRDSVKNYFRNPRRTWRNFRRNSWKNPGNNSWTIPERIPESIPGAISKGSSRKNGEGTHWEMA